MGLVQEESKKVIFEEALASGLGKEDAEEVTELTFLKMDGTDQGRSARQEHLSNETLLELLRHDSDEVWVTCMKGKKGQA